MEAPDQRPRLVSRRQARVRRPAGRRLSDGAAKEANLPRAVEAPPTALKAVRGTGPGPLQVRRESAYGDRPREAVHQAADDRARHAWRAVRGQGDEQPA